MGNQEETAQPGKEKRTQSPPAAPQPHFWVLTQETSSALCTSTESVCLRGALQDEVSVWTAAATKRRIDSIWSHERALVA